MLGIHFAFETVDFFRDFSKFRGFVFGVVSCEEAIFDIFDEILWYSLFWHDKSIIFLLH